jgi:hypothetical protein
MASSEIYIQVFMVFQLEWQATRWPLLGKETIIMLRFWLLVDEQPAGYI